MNKISITNWVNLSLIVIAVISELNYKGGSCGPYLGDFLLLGLILFSGILFLASLIRKDSWLSSALDLIILSGLVAYVFYLR